MSTTVWWCWRCTLLQIEVEGRQVESLQQELEITQAKVYFEYVGRDNLYRNSRISAEHRTLVCLLQNVGSNLNSLFTRCNEAMMLTWTYPIIHPHHLHMHHLVMWHVFSAQKLARRQDIWHGSCADLTCPGAWVEEECWRGTISSRKSAASSETHHCAHQQAWAGECLILS